MAYKNQKKNKAHNDELRKMKKAKKSKTSGKSRMQKNLDEITLKMLLHSQGLI